VAEEVGVYLPMSLKCLLYLLVLYVLYSSSQHAFTQRASRGKRQIKATRISKGQPSRGMAPPWLSIQIPLDLVITHRSLKPPRGSPLFFLQVITSFLYLRPACTTRRTGRRDQDIKERPNQRFRMRIGNRGMGTGRLSRTGLNGTERVAGVGRLLSAL